ncbi:MAG: hypothetical protein DSY80_00500, partial [Desulfocapsa sp.]
YQAVGAYDLNASLINLNEPGVNDLTIHTAPTLSATNGWVSDGTTMLDTGYTGQTPSVIFSVKAAGNERFVLGAYVSNNRFSAVSTLGMGGCMFGTSTDIDNGWYDSHLFIAETDVGAILQQSADNYIGWSITNGYGILRNYPPNTTAEWGILAAKNTSSGTPYNGITGSMQAVVMYSGTTYLTQAQIEAVAAHIQKLKEVYG